MASRKYRILSFSMAAIAFLSSWFVLYSSQLKGFPDGYLTDLDRALKPLSHIYAGTGVLFGLLFLFWGWIAPKKEFKKKLVLTVVCFAVFVVGMLAIYYDLSLNLEDGTGG